MLCLFNTTAVNQEYETNRKQRYKKNINHENINIKRRIHVTSKYKQNNKHRPTQLSGIESQINRSAAQRPQWDSVTNHCTRRKPTQLSGIGRNWHKRSATTATFNDQPMHSNGALHRQKCAPQKTTPTNATNWYKKGTRKLKITSSGQHPKSQQRAMSLMKELNPRGQKR